ncbi:MAG TPA: cytochrome c [Bauldia sp.]|nr:cytochrome c [Bauldia sp.]
MNGPIAASLALAAATLILPAGANAMDPAAQRGLTFAQANCSLCHAIGPAGSSPLPAAPPFRTLSERLPLDTLPQRFATGFVAKHPSMPQFTLDAAQIDDLMAYIRSIQ